MKHPVTIRPAAAADLESARAWYNTQREGLGDEFLAYAGAALEQIEKFPLRFPVYYKGFRRILTRRFPYKIFYCVVGTNVVVFRVLHAARKHQRELR